MFLTLARCDCEPASKMTGDGQGILQQRQALGPGVRPAAFTEELEVKRQALRCTTARQEIDKYAADGVNKLLVGGWAGFSKQ